MNDDVLSGQRVRYFLDSPMLGESVRSAVDGAWWPRTEDVAAELSGLVVALQYRDADRRHGPVAHVLLRSSDWPEHPRTVRVSGPVDTRVVRLSWFDGLPSGLITMIYADGHRVDMLTMPLDVDDLQVWAEMERAAVAADTDPGDVPAEQVWESEGGRLRPDAPYGGRRGGGRWAAAPASHHEYVL